MFKAMIEADNRKEAKLRAERDVVRNDYALFEKYMNIYSTFQLKSLYTMQLMRDVDRHISRQDRYKLIDSNDLPELFKLIQPI